MINIKHANEILFLVKIDTFKNFVSNCDLKTNNIIFFTRKGLQQDINCNIGKLISKSEIYKITKRLKLLQKLTKNNDFICLVWRSNLDLEENTWSINTNIILNFLEFVEILNHQK